MNEKYEITTGAGFFYSQGESISVYADAVLAEPVNREVLCRAMELVLQRFPYFAVKVGVDEANGRYILVPNDKPFVPVEKNGFICPEDADSDGYLFSVTYYDNHIFLQIFHGLTDGMGTVALLQTIVRTYFECLDGKTYHCPGISVREQPCEEEYRDPYEYARPLGEPAFQLKKNKGFSFAPEQTNDSNRRLYCFSVPEQSVVDYARDYDGGVSGILALALARAIDTIELPDKPVLIACPMDMRRNLGCGTNLRNCSKSTRYTYSAALRDRPYFEQLSLFKMQLMLQAQKERQIPRYIEDKETLDKVYALKTLDEKIEFYKSDNLNQEPIVTYMGKVDFGELNDRVEDFLVYTRVSGTAGMLCACSIYKGRLNVCISCNLSTTAHVRMFANEMKDFCVECSPIVRVDYDSPAKKQQILSWKEETACV